MNLIDKRTEDENKRRKKKKRKYERINRSASHDRI